MTALYPKLRFPEFQNSQSWEAVQLGTVSVQVTERVGKRKLVPISISAGIGFVPQAEKFGRDISGNQYELYTVATDGDFVYNKGNSLTFPQGCIYLLRGWGQVAAPNVFICFRLKPGYSNGFFQYCFEQNQHGRELQKHITSGARSNGLLNISRDTFFGIKIAIPTISEQEKIAECLTSLDEVIAAESRKLEALRKHKKYLLQNLFPCEGETTPRLRFPEFEERGGWEQITLKKLCDLKAGSFVPASAIATHPAADAHPCYGGNGLRGFVRSYTHEGVYPLVGRQGAHCGNVHLVSGKFHATEHAIVATPRGSTGVWWLYYALENLNLNRFATGQAQPGLSVSSLNTVELTAPCESEEQHRIAQCLRYLDSLVSEQSKRLEAFKSHKKSLMQGLFPTINSCD